MKIEVNPDWWKTLFDEVYLLTDARSVCDEQITQREIDLLCQILPMQSRDRILDLCGGQGRHSIELARRGYTYCTVLDYSETLLEHGRRLSSEAGLNIEFVQGDATATGLPTASFEYVLVLGNSLGYLPDDSADLRILEEALRLLTPGGWLLVDVTDGAVVRERFNPNAWHEIEDKIVVCRQRELAENCIRAREVVICKENGLVRDQSYAIRTYRHEDLLQLVSQAGFVDVRISGEVAGQNLVNQDYGFMNHRLMVTARKDKSAL